MCLPSGALHTSSSSTTEEQIPRPAENVKMCIHDAFSNILVTEPVINIDITLVCL